MAYKYGQKFPKRQIFYISESDEEIIKLLAAGLTHVEIGKIIFRSARTVDNQVDNLQREMNARNTAHLISILYEEGHLIVKEKVPEHDVPKYSNPDFAQGKDEEL